MAAMKHGTFYFRTLFALYVNFSFDLHISESSHQVYNKVLLRLYFVLVYFCKFYCLSRRILRIFIFTLSLITRPQVGLLRG